MIFDQWMKHQSIKDHIIMIKTTLWTSRSPIITPNLRLSLMFIVTTWGHQHREKKPQCYQSRKISKRITNEVVYFTFYTSWGFLTSARVTSWGRLPCKEGENYFFYFLACREENEFILFFALQRRKLLFCSHSSFSTYIHCRYLYSSLNTYSSTFKPFMTFKTFNIWDAVVPEYMGGHHMWWDLELLLFFFWLEQV